MEKDAFQPPDDAARALARDLMAQATSAALGVVLPESGAPMVTRVAFALGPSGAPMSLVSELAPHCAALRKRPDASLLVGEPGQRGDPLTHPRLTLQAGARFIGRGEPSHAALRAAWLAARPKSALYIDFADFHLVAFDVTAGHLNAGFGRAFRLAPADLGL